MRGSTGARLRSTQAMEATSVAWPTRSYKADSTRTPAALRRCASIRVLRWGSTTVSSAGASSSAGGDRPDTCAMGWLSAGVAGQLKATWVSGSPMGKKSYGPASPIQPASLAGVKPSAASQRGSSASMAAL